MAYAAVVSLQQILHQLLLSDQLQIHFPNPEIESLHEKIRSFQTFLEKKFPVPKTHRSRVNELETQIRDAIYELEDTIESCISKQSSGDDTKGSDTIQRLHDLVQTIDSIKEGTDQIMSEHLPTSHLLQGDNSVTSRSPVFGGKKNKIVGLEEDLNQLKDQLTSESSEKLEVVPIVGMAGIGKTTLATALYDDPLIESHFDTRAWVTVSQEYRVRDIYSGLLSSMRKFDEKMGQESDDQLATYLHRNLMGSRYLIVVDDMWDTEIWDRVRRFFPDDKNGSRILLTTRISKVAQYANSSRQPHKMRFLDKENSWKLLCQKAFADGHCPPHLEKIGMEIAEKCGGLGLALVVVGGLLSKSGYNPEYWEIVAEDINSAIVTNKTEPCMEILSLSYNYLPSRLKGCFLYMGAFPEDSEIPVSKLTKLWIAEGFLNPPAPPKNMEDVAQEFFVDLIERNLILIRKLSSNGRQIKTCKIHDLIRDLCVKESKKEKFFYVINRYVESFPEGAENQRRVYVHKNILLCMEEMYKLAQSIKLARSLVYAGAHHHHPVPFCLTYELLRVLDALTVYFIEFPSEIVELVHLRYLSFTYNGKILGSISKLQNLQILIVRQHPKIIFTGASVLPVEIWNMPKLRHLHFIESNLPDIPSGDVSVFLENLQSLSNVNAYCCTKEVLRNVPNLKRLSIWIESPDTLPFFLDELSQLETLKFFVLNPIPGSKVEFQPKLAFPSTLRKLSLSGCGIPWEDMTILGKLEFLEVLKLRELAFQGPEWEPNEDEFQQLKFLLLESLDLVHWIAEKYHFPCLRSLFINHCYELEEVPSEIGNIETLQLIELVDCSPSAAASTKQIQEEQKDYGNEELQVRVYSSWE